jgi:Ca2+-binding EF-hand superfamily protein
VADAGKELSTEEVGCLLRVVDKRGEGQLYIEDFKHFFATLGLKKEH